MRILILGNSDEGLYKFRKELIERLLRENFEVAVSTPYGDYIPVLEEMGCQYICLEYNRKGKNPWNEFRLLVRYGRILKKELWDAVLLYTIKPILYAGFWCRIRKIPYLANITGLSPVIANPGIINQICFLIFRRVLPYAHRVYFQNIDNLSLFRQKSAVRENITLLPGSGVNLSQHKYEKYEENAPIKILYIGRITKVKGIDELLRAIEMIDKNEIHVVFEFIGKCDEEYENCIKILNDEKKIVYHGVQQNPHDYVKKAQAVIMPSYGEGMSNVLLEGAACGRPLLASDVSGCREIVKDKVTGFLFEPHNADSIVEAVRKLLSLSYDQREKMGIEGRRHVEKRFSREIVIQEYMDQIYMLGKEN